MVGRSGRSGSDGPADCGGDSADLLHQERELVGEDGLGPIHQSGLRRRMDIDNEAVGAGSHPGEGERISEAA